MPYDDAALYSNIYNTQSGLDDEQKQIMDDVMRAASLMDTKQKDEEPTPAEIDLIAERIGMVQLRLSLLNSYIDGLDKAYKKFGTEHAGG